MNKQTNDLNGQVLKENPNEEIMEIRSNNSIFSSGVSKRTSSELSTNKKF